MSRLLALVSVAFAIFASASPLDAAAQTSPAVKPKLPFTTRINAGKTGRTNGVSHIIEADRARVAHIKGDAAIRKAKAAHESGKINVTHRQRTTYSINATNAVVTYTVNVSVSDNILRTLIVDTGSSNTWIGGEVPYTNSACDDSDFFYITYGSGSVYGKECTEQLKLNPDLVVESQSIGVAEDASGFNPGTDGILGLGPIGLTEGTTIENDYVPTVLGNLHSQGSLVDEAVGILYAPLTADYVVNGELTFGGADHSAYVGTLQYINLTNTYPANLYWGIDLSVSYGNSTILSQTAGIVDTGTTLVYLASDTFISYMTATGAVYDTDGTDLLTITEEQYAALQPLVFHIGNTIFALSPNAQIWPRASNADLGGVASKIYLAVANIGSYSGGGLDFIMGYAFLERFYTVFDTTNGRFGIAQTKSTDATTN